MYNNFNAHTGSSSSYYYNNIQRSNSNNNDHAQRINFLRQLLRSLNHKNGINFNEQIQELNDLQVIPSDPPNDKFAIIEHMLNAQQIIDLCEQLSKYRFSDYDESYRNNPPQIELSNIKDIYTSKYINQSNHLLHLYPTSAYAFDLNRVITIIEQTVINVDDKLTQDDKEVIKEVIYDIQENLDLATLVSNNHNDNYISSKNKDNFEKTYNTLTIIIEDILSKNIPSNIKSQLKNEARQVQKQITSLLYQITAEEKTSQQKYTQNILEQREQEAYNRLDNQMKDTSIQSLQVAASSSYVKDDIITTKTEIQNKQDLYKQQKRVLDVSIPEQKYQLANLDQEILSLQRAMLENIDNKITSCRNLCQISLLEQYIVARHELITQMIPSIDFIQGAMINDNTILNNFNAHISRALSSYVAAARVYDPARQDRLMVRFSTKCSNNLNMASNLLNIASKSALVAESIGATILPGLAIITKTVQVASLQLEKMKFDGEQKRLSIFIGDFSDNETEIISTLSRACTFIFAQILSMIKSQIQLNTYNNSTVDCSAQNILKEFNSYLVACDKNANKINIAKKIEHKAKKMIGKENQDKVNLDFMEHFAFLIASSSLDAMMTESEKPNYNKNNPKQLVIVAVQNLIKQLKLDNPQEMRMTLNSSSYATNNSSKHLIRSNQLGIKPIYNSNLVTYGKGNAPDSWYDKMA